MCSSMETARDENGTMPARTMQASAKYGFIGESKSIAMIALCRMGRSCQPTVSIVIPAFNEAGRIGPSLRKIDEFVRQRPQFIEVIVVADGCTDRTVDIVNQSGTSKLRLIDNNKHHGKGYCVRQGVRAASGEYVLFVDTDL